MENFFDAIVQAVRQAREQENAIANNANNMAELLVNNLRAVRPHWLRRLKRELQKFDATTGKWKP